MVINFKYQEPSTLREILNLGNETFSDQSHSFKKKKYSLFLAIAIFFVRYISIQPFRL